MKKKNKRFICTEMIDLKSVKGGMGGPVTIGINWGTITGHIAQGQDPNPNNVDHYDWNDEGLC